MQTLLKSLPSVKTLLILAAFCGAIVFGFKEVILTTIKAGDNNSLTLVLAFLTFFVLITLGITGFYAINKTDVDAERERTNVAKVTGSKKVKGTQRGAGGYLEVDDSEEVELEQDNSIREAADKKKAP